MGEPESELETLFRICSMDSIVAHEPLYRMQSVLLTGFIVLIVRLSH